MHYFKCLSPSVMEAVMSYKRRNQLSLFIGALLLGVLLTGIPSFAGQTLDTIKKRNMLRCGVSGGIAGLSMKDASGRWNGLDAEFCRAVAAAVLGDGEKVAFVPLKAPERFPALKSKIVDILVRNTTWTFEREAGLKLEFPGILYHDGQGFIVAAASGISKLSGLNQKSICLVKGATHVQNTAAYFAGRGWRYTPMFFDTNTDAHRAFYDRKCQALAADSLQLAGVRKNAPDGPGRYRILPDIISREPIGPVVRQGDEEFSTIVRWVLFVQIAAEEHGITKQNVRSMIGSNRQTELALAFSPSKQSMKALGIHPDWIIRVIESSGNYGEMLERTIGKHGGLGVDRGLNKPWSSGGILYAPPLR